MRILHTSDWHLGQNFYSKSREAEHQAFLDWLRLLLPVMFSIPARRPVTPARYTTVLLSIYSKLAVIWWYWQETMTRSPR